MIKEDRDEIIVKGLFLALILFLSTLVNLLIQQDIQHLKIVSISLIPIIIGYCLLGMFIRWMVYRNALRREGPNIFSGSAIIYWIFMFSIIIMVCASFIPQFIRDTITVNVAALLLVWLLNYLYLKNIAKELNSDLEYYCRVLVEDLPRKPQTEDMFMEEIENYCKKANLSLEIIEYGIPAKIKMNNTLYMVKSGQYYTIMEGTVYTLEFHNMISSQMNKAN